MPYKGTNLRAWNKAKKGQTSKERSKIYYREKAKDNYRSSNFITRFSLFRKNKNQAYRVKILNNSTLLPSTKVIKYVPKQLILDDIRDYRSSQIISSISNGLATFLVKTASCEMSNYQMNLLRSGIAFVTSEVLNKLLEKPLEVIDKIKLFIKISKSVYRAVVRFNEEISSYELENVKKVSSFSKEYRSFKRKYFPYKRQEDDENASMRYGLEI